MYYAFNTFADFLSIWVSVLFSWWLRTKASTFAVATFSQANLIWRLRGVNSKVSSGWEGEEEGKRWLSCHEACVPVQKRLFWLDQDYRADCTFCFATEMHILGFLLCMSVYCNWLPSMKDSFSGHFQCTFTLDRWVSLNKSWKGTFELIRKSFHNMGDGRSFYSCVEGQCET